MVDETHHDAELEVRSLMALVNRDLAKWVVVVGVGRVGRRREWVRKVRGEEGGGGWRRGRWRGGGRPPSYHRRWVM